MLLIFRVKNRICLGGTHFNFTFDHFPTPDATYGKPVESFSILTAKPLGALVDLAKAFPYFFRDGVRQCVLFPL